VCSGPDFLTLRSHPHPGTAPKIYESSMPCLAGTGCAFLLEEVRRFALLLLATCLRRVPRPKYHVLHATVLTLM
jgi:hypothetical protein